MIPNICDSVFVLLVTTYILATINIRFVFIPLILVPFLAVALIIFRRKAKKFQKNPKL